MNITNFLTAETKSKIPYSCMLDIITGGESYVKYQMEAYNKYKRIKSFTIEQNRMLDKCFTAIYAVTGKNAKDICSKGKKGILPMCRSIIGKYLREEKEMTYVDIGKVFNRDHSTIIHGKDAQWNNEFDFMFIENYAKFLKLMED